MAAAADADVLTAVYAAKTKGIADAILVGDVVEIRKIFDELDIDDGLFELENVPDPKLAARFAANLVKRGSAQVMMKGMVGTADFMRAVLDKTEGLGTGRLLFHVVAFEPAGYDRLLLMSDAAINIAPNPVKKFSYRECAASLSCNRQPESENCHVGAVETVTSSMKATEDAALIAKMATPAESRGCLIDRPLALDNAVSLTAAKRKGIGGDVAGRADLLVVPNIEAGNVLYK